jgi:hypothetical protein
MKISTIKHLFAALALVVFTGALSGCYIAPGYSYVQGNGYAGDVYYGSTPAAGYYSSYPYYGYYPYGYGYGYGYGWGCCYGPVIVGGGWGGRYYGRGYYGHGYYGGGHGGWSGHGGSYGHSSGGHSGGGGGNGHH